MSHQGAEEERQIREFILTLKQRHGYDFGQYAPASFKRRLRALCTRCGAESIAALSRRVRDEPSFLRQVLAGLSVPVSEMFRDPWVFEILRREVLPILASYPRIHIWQAGCARGEEVYSLAILLQEEGLYEKSQIFATDLNDVALEEAAEGIYPAANARLYAENYLRAGGRASLSHYFRARYERIKFDESLKRNVTFASHNLSTDGVFAEVQLILCRNVLIYFNDALQDRVLQLFRDSLVHKGFLCLGSKETLAHTAVEGDFEPFAATARLYRRRARR
ncbi:MAG: protein-glutamate O-methyltransferase CheR [Nevskia sp.]|nr:protein-glutamate O-methyltransferase CheR [Nevskia sp.]